MSANWDEAIPKPRQEFTKISSSAGAYHGWFLGFTDTWEATDRCFNCKGVRGNDCKKCKGEGQVTQTTIALKYDLGNGTTEQEQMPFKISPARMVNGQPVRCSKLFERLLELSGLNDPEDPPGPGDLGRWGKEHKDCRVSCLIIIKQPGNYPKITEVIAREETGVTSRTRVGHALPGDIAQRARETKFAVVYLRSIFPKAFYTPEERARAKEQRLHEKIASDSTRAVTQARIGNQRWRGQDRTLEHPDGRRLS
jgi:hypothetical protein